MRRDDRDDHAQHVRAALPAYTLQVADALAESVRVLAYTTRTGAGIGDPAAACELLGALYAATGGLPQALRQLGGWLHQQVEAETLTADQDHDVPALVDAAQEALARAAGPLPAVTFALQDAQNAMSGLYIHIPATVECDGEATRSRRTP